ncbi:RNA pseudouridylate synthase domain containing protein 2 [Nowakowskiella sp. JEL0407]|nr:RNA pseudouridylate synthase domain containing protein 2 [Nowakowskiella sp. JEL0407]
MANLESESEKKRIAEDSNSNVPVKKQKGTAKRKGKLPPPTTAYYSENGLRKVVPYEWNFQTYAKGRWWGKTVYDVFSREFKDQSPEYYEDAIKTGRITVNGEKASLDFVLKNGDVVGHFVHRHEPPIADLPVRIAHRLDDLLTVDKPCSLPIHPTGRYHANTMINLLHFDHGIPLDSLFPCNRLDRLTSGLVLVALTKERSQEIAKVMQNREIKKTYLARVRGEFPSGEIVCEEPIEVISFKLGINKVSPNGKYCKTVFERLSFNGITSVVLCKPVTGRSHQIRVHLQYLGHPIANDPIYCSLIWGDDLGKGGVDSTSTQSVLAQFEQILPTASIPPPESSSNNNSNSNDNNSNDEESRTTSTEPTQTKNETKQSTWTASNGSEYTCQGCLQKRRDPIPEQLSIWLHAWQYEWGSECYETERPEWSNEGFKGDEELQERFWKFGGRWDGRSPGEFIDDGDEE